MSVTSILFAIAINLLGLSTLVRAHLRSDGKALVVNAKLMRLYTVLPFGLMVFGMIVSALSIAIAPESGVSLFGLISLMILSLLGISPIVLIAWSVPDYTLINVEAKTEIGTQMHHVNLHHSLH